MKKLNSVEIASSAVMFFAISIVVIVSLIDSCNEHKAIADINAQADSISTVIENARKNSVTIKPAMSEKAKRDKNKKKKNHNSPKQTMSEPKSRNYLDEDVNE